MKDEKEKSYFDEDDASLFRCDDRDLKAKAIRNSIIPRLLDIVKECVTEIHRVYGVDAFDVSTLCWSPHSAESRGKGYKCDFNTASAGICVKRVKNRPLHIFELRLLLSSQGLEVVFYIRKCALEDEMAKAIADFIAQHEVEVLSLITIVAGKFHLVDGKKKCSLPDWFPLSKNVAVLASHRKSQMFVWSYRYPLPTTEMRKKCLVLMFSLLYPLYWAVAEIGEGREPLVFDEMVRRAFQLRKEKTIEFGKRDNRKHDVSDVDEEHIESLADSKAKVPVGRRWQVFERDGWRCVSCGRSANDGAILEVDHIVPRSKGGTDTLDNFQTLCRDCNIGKSNRSATDLRVREGKK